MSAKTYTVHFGFRDAECEVDFRCGCKRTAQELGEAIVAGIEGAEFWYITSPWNPEG